jgi:hypothetical protein
MPWINLTARRGALSPQKRHALFADLTSTLMFWEKVPDTPEARSFMKGWYYEVAEDADYNGGIHEHESRSTSSRAECHLAASPRWIGSVSCATSRSWS